jgi:hypothetical protein
LFTYSTLYFCIGNLTVICHHPRLTPHKQASDAPSARDSEDSLSRPASCRGAERTAGTDEQPGDLKTCRGAAAHVPARSLRAVGIREVYKKKPSRNYLHSTILGLKRQEEREQTVLPMSSVLVCGTYALPQTDRSPAGGIERRATRRR